MKRFFHIIKHSFGTVTAFKLRTFFCLISVALGIASITIIVAATEGAYERAFEMVERFGPDSLIVIGGSEEARAVGQRDKTISLDDVEAVRQSFPSAYVVVPMSGTMSIVSYKDKKHQTRITASTSDYSRGWSWPVIQGSDLTEEDVKGLRNVALIGQELVRELFGDKDPVGKYIFVNRIPFQIVGVLSERGTSPSGHSLDDRIVIPLTTYMRKIENQRIYISNFRVRFLDQSNLNKHVEELRAFLRQRHGIINDQPDDFRIISPQEIIKFLVALTGSLVAFIGVAGITCLVVAGFVLANLFLLSVKERTKEIGIRRSVGAKRKDILVQFWGEAVILTGTGGVLGFLLGVISSKLLVLIAEFPIHFSWRAFAIGLALSLLVGIVFGLQPASRAAQMNPVDALRG